MILLLFPRQLDECPEKTSSEEQRGVYVGVMSIMSLNISHGLNIDRHPIDLGWDDVFRSKLL